VLRSAAFETIGRERPDAIFVGTSPFLNGRRVQLTQLATFHRLPGIYALRDYAEVGGLMTYGSDIVDGYRQIGVYAGRILKGAMPSELPVVQSSKFELVINASWQASEDRRIMATCGDQHETVPDCIVKAQAPPDMKDRAY
jgi:ABC-type uncharacterized transport system substrate-binding protein